MKLGVSCPYGHPLTLALKAATRAELPAFVQVTCPTHVIFTVTRNEIVATKGGGQVGSGAALGALAGLIAGPAGIVIGGALGAILGASASENDEAAVRRFNES